MTHFRTYFGLWFGLSLENEDDCQGRLLCQNWNVESFSTLWCQNDDEYKGQTVNVLRGMNEEIANTFSKTLAQ